MTIDVLQDMLNTIRLQAYLAGIYTVSAPWGFQTVPGDHHIAFLVILERGGIFEIDEEEQPPCHLQAGDIVVLPRGHRYSMRDRRQSPVVPWLSFQKQEPGVLGPITRFASGCYSFVDHSTRPVFSMLPSLIHLRQQDWQAIPEIDLLVRLFLEEAAHEEVSRQAILCRLAEVLFMHILRLFTTQLQNSSGSWLRGLADPPVAAALAAIHADPAAPWTVETLAAEANLSRSGFAARFKAIVGEPPLQYLQRWRMQRAAHLIDAGNLPLKTIIERSGYSSEAAFRKAFQQWIGISPSQYQTRRKAHGQMEGKSS
jgi:AraC-like DNA-binding protein